MLPLSSVIVSLVRGRGAPLLPVSRPAVATAPAAASLPVGRDGARAPRSPVREEGLGWAEAGRQQPGVVVLVAGR
jgi:hypothetical protein